jgi:hypothetical protein
MKMTLNAKAITMALWGISLSCLGQTNQTLGIFTNAAESFNGYHYSRLCQTKPLI